MQRAHHRLHQLRLLLQCAFVGDQPVGRDLQILIEGDLHRFDAGIAQHDRTVDGIVHSRVHQVFTHRRRLREANALHLNVGFSQSCHIQQSPQRNVSGPERSRNPDSAAGQVRRFVNAGIGLGKDCDRVAGIPVHHISDR